MNDHEISIMERASNRMQSHLDGVTLKECPNCDNVGYFIWDDCGSAVREDCNFCTMVVDSVYNGGKIKQG
jgi:hypothetical protein